MRHGDAGIDAEMWASMQIGGEIVNRHAYQRGGELGRRAVLARVGPPEVLAHPTTTALESAGSQRCGRRRRRRQAMRGRGSPNPSLQSIGAVGYGDAAQRLNAAAAARGGGDGGTCRRQCRPMYSPSTSPAVAMNAAAAWRTGSA